MENTLTFRSPWQLSSTQGLGLDVMEKSWCPGSPQQTGSRRGRLLVGGLSSVLLMCVVYYLITHHL